jgi:hypothetical protein
MAPFFAATDTQIAPGDSNVGVASENGLQSTLRGMHILKTNGLARLHNGDKPVLSLGCKLLILFARNFLSVLYCPFPEATPRGAIMNQSVTRAAGYKASLGLRAKRYL